MKKPIYIFLLLTLSLLFINCSDSDSSSDTSSNDTNGKGGSLATFILKNDYLYTVDQYNLNVFSIKSPLNPEKVNQVPVGFDIETLFSDREYLYIGSQNGMFIYSIKNPELPEQLASVQHFSACDPVVANKTHAFVTLHSNSDCGNNINELQTYNIEDPKNPKLLNTRSMNHPKGMALYGDYLIVCDDVIKVFDISDPNNSQFKFSINQEAHDVIIDDDILLAVGKYRIEQYQLYNDPISEELTSKKLSSIDIQ